MNLLSRYTFSGKSTEAVFLLTILVFGCGVSENEKLIQVFGKITVDGKPAEGATLLFHPNGNSTSSVATGTATSDGKFKLITNTKAGIAAGKFNVTVVWPDPSVKPTEKQLMSGMSFDAPDLLKGRYIMKDKSGLTAEISSSTKELPPFDLTTK